jgi:hypothetical protein
VSLRGWDERVSCSVVNFLGLDGCQVVDGLVGAHGVEPVDPVQGLDLDVLDVAPGALGPNQLGLVGADLGLGPRRSAFGHCDRLWPTASPARFWRSPRDDPDETQLSCPGPGDANAYSLYTEALNVATIYLGGDFGNAGRQFQLAMVMVNWMRGYPLARIIRERYDFYRQRNQARPLDPLIRETMGDVEKYARFEAPKYLSCYLDILNLETAARGITAPAATMDIEMMLELGVSRTTEVSLMSLGLSRASVLALSGLIDEDVLTPTDAQAWAAGLDVESLDLPVLIAREIGRVQERITNNGSDEPAAE